MKKLNLMVIVTVFTMILLCSCAQNNDVMASVNGIDIKKSDYEMRLKSNEIMAELMTEDINNSDFTSEEKNAKIMEIKEKCSTDKETIINSMIETAFIDSKYDSITHEQAKSEIEKQMSNLDDYAVEYPQVAANGKIMDEYIKRMGITKEEYLDLKPMICAAVQPRVEPMNIVGTISPPRNPEPIVTAVKIILSKNANPNASPFIAFSIIFTPEPL